MAARTAGPALAPADHRLPERLRRPAGRFSGEHVWHVHEQTDEFFLVITGEIQIALREDGGERVVTLPRGSVFVVPRGTFHKPSSAAGAAVLLLEPTGTLSVGDEHDKVPDYVDVTTGHPVAGAQPAARSEKARR